MSELSDYEVRSADWRGQLRKNRNRTRWVILIYCAIYLAIGILVDLYFYTTLYNATVSQVLYAILHLKIIPYATLITVGIAILSLLVTYTLYDKIMLLGTEYHEVTPENFQSVEEQQLYNVVEEMKIAAGLKYMPRVFIIEANYMNAFASGYSEKSAMVAITRGLMHKLDRAEMQAVMAHELSHIRHQDIKLTLTASVLSNLMLIILDLLFYNVLFSRRSDQRGGNQLLFIIILVRYLLPIITLLLMLYLSRTREYMADSGSVELMRDNQPLGRALLKIHNDHQDHAAEYRQAYGQTAHEDVRRAAYLYDPVKSGVEPVKSLTSAFSTHPSLEKRLKAIGINLKK